ncbi:ArsR/SmtB family transcription factor [Kordiimonas marina]|uniref:ArsR/SmtB family transcription factor n=1 Tax=Kordiimonas marina TaxID=2872312 RepID=UPI001FF42085|nr:metalloregulator ArsR/SmtB family transcription factor [Kordiimonas marina]MCJ9429380.1 metalloregulator ArsR/SmtB family transcription factor [Kordiimonas marina]
MEELLAALRAASETTRLRILALLAKGELTVSDLVRILDQSQPRVSRHLKLMGDAGLLDRFQEGTTVFYRLAEGGQGAAVHAALLPMIPEDDADFQADLTVLADIRAERVKKADSFFRENAAEWDRIRSLYVAEAQVEAALQDLQGKRPVHRLLDVGTGTGRMLEVFAPLADQALGIDVSREMLSVARGNLARRELTNCQVRQGDMYNLGLADGSEDLILFHQVLHFADEPAAAIREAARVLSPGGQLLIADFAPHGEEYLREEQAHRRLGFADEEIAQWGRAAGLGDATIRHLDGGKLRVTIWRFEKAAAAPSGKE